MQPGAIINPRDTWPRFDGGFTMELQASQALLFVLFCVCFHTSLAYSAWLWMPDGRPNHGAASKPCPVLAGSLPVGMSTVQRLLWALRLPALPYPAAARCLALQR